MDQTVICIAGAHRSGTSLLTRLLQRYGLYLGPESEMMPPREDNPDGFWENLRFVGLNDEVLSAVGAAWDLPPRESEPFEGEQLNPVRAKASLLVERFRSAPTWGWKDPRNSLTLPFWRALLPATKTIIVVRNPLEAAYSMHKRNGTSYALGLRLWEIYNRRALANTAPEDRLITSYQAFFDDPERELQTIADFAGVDGSNIANATSLISHSRRHTTFSIEQMIDAGVSPETVTLFQHLVSGRAIPNESLKPVHVDQLSGAASRINKSIPDGEDIRKELATRRGDEIRHHETLARHLETIEGLRKEIGENNVRAAGEIGRRDGRIEELEKACAHLDQTRREEVEKIRDRFNQTNQLLQSLSLRLSAAETRNVSLTDRLRKQLLELKKLLRILDQTSNAATLLRQSRRWRVANPFAALRALLTNKPLEGFGHLDNNVAKYHAWRQSHPEVESLSDEIKSLRTYEGLIPAGVSAPTKQLKSNSPPIVTRPPAPTKPIEFARHEEVEVSIVIPVFNQIDYTLACLVAVQEHSGLLPYEVIVVDDCSTDSTPATIGRIQGLIYLRSEANSGFIASCNRGAECARGRYLLFLNNDTTVTPGWLAALRETFDIEPKAGLVGSKLVYADGRLQEAGGIIWCDGSGWNRGKFDDPAKPEYNYTREVDYCSGACIMIPKDTFEEVDGFDQRFAPAYYEDVDLAFKLRRAGYKVLYQPFSEVIHFEGATAGVDLTAGAKRYQDINRTIFVEKWAEALSEKPTNGDVANLEKPPIGKQHILVVDHHLPMPNRDAGSLRMFNILHILQCLGHRVTFIPDNLADIPPYGAELQKRGVEIVFHPYLKSVRQYLEEHGRKFDTVVLSRCDFAKKHVANVRLYAPQARLIFDTVDLHFLRQQREAALREDEELRDQADDRKRAEFQLIDQTDETWVVSTFEQKLLREERPDKSIEIVSMIVDTPGSTTPFSLRRDFLFIGSFQHAPNIDAVLFFTKEILPLVKQRLARARFYIIGDKAPPSVIALADEDVIVTGAQPEVKSFFDSVKLSVAPLRYGAGVKGKINQSMGLGVPVVATSLAAEGMPLSNGEDILLADAPEDFAQAIIELCENENLWERLSHNGVVKTQDFYSEKAARLQLTKLFGERQSINKSSGTVASKSAVPRQAAGDSGNGRVG